MLEIKETGAVLLEGIVVGEFDPQERRLVLNLGWCRLADLKLTVEGDPKEDRRRILLARPADPRRLAGGDQLPLPTEQREQSSSGSA